MKFSNGRNRWFNVFLQFKNMKLFAVEQRKKLLKEELKRIIEVLKRDYEPEKISIKKAVLGRGGSLL